jgi:hypothetical protein
VRVPTRTHSPPQLEFMKRKLDEYEELGLIYKNPTSEWASPPLILPKVGPAKIRFTVDLRVPNAQTIPVVRPMTHLTDTLNNFQGSVLFGSFVFVHGYWQMLLDEDSQKCQSIGTALESTLPLECYSELPMQPCTCKLWWSTS